jgi:hypothetical protein
VFECSRGFYSKAYRKRVNHMLIVTTIYSMELETAKRLSADEPAEESVEAKIPMDDREFLGIYQGSQGSQVRGQESE